MKRNPRGTGSIYFNKQKNKYYGQITIGYDSDGKQKRKTVFGNTKTEVRKAMDELRLKSQDMVFVNSSNVTIYEIIKAYQDDLFEMNAIKEGTYRRNLDTLKKLEPISSIKIQEINEYQIKHFINSLTDYSQSLINKVYQMTKKAFDEAMEREIINKNPMLRVKKPYSKQKKLKVRALSLEEQTKLAKILYANPKIKYRNQYLIAMFTGMRMGEINALDVEDIDFEKHTISITKTISVGLNWYSVVSDTTKTDAGTRTVHITKEVEELLKESIGDKKTGLIFQSRTGIISTSAVNDKFRRLIEQYDFIDYSIKGKVSQHSLRHTYATRCIEGGMIPKVLQSILGHTEISVTMDTYCDAFEKFNLKNLESANNYMRSVGLLKND